MSPPPTCEELLPLIPAYAIGATDAEETRLIEAHLPTCPQLAAELAAFRAVSDALANAVPQHAAPAAVLANLMSAAAARPADRGHRRRWLMGAAAAIALIALIGANNLYWIDRLRAVERRTVTVDAARILTLPTAVNGVATGARGQVVWLPDAEAGLLLAVDFPAHAVDTVYQAWVTRADQITSLGTFTVTDDGTASLTFPAALLAETFDAVGVTLEPGTGSDRPTSPPLVRWQRRI